MAVNFLSVTYFGVFNFGTSYLEAKIGQNKTMTKISRFTVVSNTKCKRNFENIFNRTKMGNTSITVIYHVMSLTVLYLCRTLSLRYSVFFTFYLMFICKIVKLIIQPILCVEFV